LNILSALKTLDFPRRTGPVRKWCMAVSVMLGLALASLHLDGQAQAADRVKVVAEAGKGFGRIVMTFSKLPKYQVRVTNGVMILAFERSIEADARSISRILSDYVIISRLDPDGKALRFALAQPVKVNTIEAGERLFIDLLPRTWVGMAPSLPPKVIADLARRAKRLAKQTRASARLKALKESKYKMKARVAEFPSFSRIQFDWNQMVEASLSRKGNEVTVLFDQLTRPDIGRLKADPPQFVTSVTSKLTDDGLKLTLKIKPGSDVRGFREGNAYVVDVAGIAVLPAQKTSGVSPQGKLIAKLTGQKIKGQNNRTEQVQIKSQKAQGVNTPKPQFVEPEK